VRSYVDGHIVLDRRLAEMGHFPAISVGQSISRVMHDVTDKAHQDAARKVRAALATYAQAEDLIRIGAYVRGSMASIDKAIELREKIVPWLRQSKNERSTFERTRATMQEIAAQWNY
jgi:flagellum-specific ATP synthase